MTKTHILDRKEFTGDLFSIFEDCMAYLQAKLNTALIPHALGRDERLELPEDALRETLVNAIAHRDYRSAANVQVYVFRDRLEIVTPGGLPAGMREEDLGTKSVPRNPLLFGMFYRMGLVEQIGSGIRRIRNLCREHGVPKALIEVSESWVSMTFPRPTAQVGTKYGPSREQDTAQVERKDQEEPKIFSNSTLQQFENLLEGLSAQVTAQVIAQVVWYCRVPRTAREIMFLLGLKHRKTFRTNYLQPLLDAGWLEMTIPDKPRSSRQKYRLTDKGRELQKRLKQPQ